MYAYDENDMLIASGGTAGYCAIAKLPDSKYDLRYIQAWLNHPYTEKLFQIMGSDFEGGFIARGTYLLRKKSQMQLRFKDIMTRISEYIKSEMYDYFTSLPSDAEQRAFVKKVMHDDPDECTELLDKVTYVDEFETVLDNRKDIWVDSMKIYLDSCVKTVYLSQIRVSASQRGRAIDIYENLNMGGVSLNTFDLIMARVAKVDKKNFLQRIKESIESTKTYPNSVLESSIKSNEAWVAVFS